MSVLSAEYLFRKLVRMMVPNVNVPVSTNFSFPCRNCFPRKIGIFFMPVGNSAWLQIVFFCECSGMLCVEQLCSEVLTWNCCCWVFSVIRVRWSSMHISMDVGKCLACSFLSLLGNFAVISLVECVWYGFLSKASLRFLGSKHILSFFLTVIW